MEHVDHMTGRALPVECMWLLCRQAERTQCIARYHKGCCEATPGLMLCCQVLQVKQAEVPAAE